MEKPKEIIKDCPECKIKEVVELEEEQVSFTTDSGNNYVGYMWIFKCKCCTFRFTTTESDDISANYVYKLTMPEDVY